MERSTAVIRPAVIEDAAGIARVHYATHVTTYVETGRMPREHVEGWTVDSRREYWTAVLTAPTSDGNARVWVADVDDAVVGFISVGSGRDDDHPRDDEIEAIYVLDAHHGSGIGTRLIDAALGERGASLWVLADNPGAHGFYARNGFVPDGVEKTDARWGDVREIRLVR
ncbi:GNAT family N-acetyltransferase [Agromyces atrinae]|uniref:GNAT family N-acetyltransferase n=1 Tax=Agromyces atrinae TaxID=592376 RepID=UPI001F587BC5|nr:GNAT family N-acetyltransferase [Agromyces atrinae]MCI2957769.1 GNAT family N-acetyltransferase [Agromyces atrinae]